MDFLHMLDSFEAALTEGPRLPRNRRLIEQEECLAILEQARLCVPDEIMNARRIGVEQERILEGARQRIGELRHAEETRRDAAIEDEALVRTAREHADRLVARAERDASRQCDEADAYARDQLEKLRERIDRILGTLDQAMADLAADPRDQGDGEVAAGAGRPSTRVAA